jgi:hypothetical protein
VTVRLVRIDTVVDEDEAAPPEGGDPSHCLADGSRTKGTLRQRDRDAARRSRPGWVGEG